MKSSKRRIRERKQQQAKRHKRIMALVIAAAGLVVMGIAGLLVVKNGAPPGYEANYDGGPRLKLAQDVYDYGYVELDTVITTDVKISNVGDEPLKIAEVPVVEVREGC